MTIYLDGKEYDSFSIYRTMSLKEYSIDTSNAKVLRIVISVEYGFPKYALGDFTVDSHAPAKTNTVPEYTSDTDFMNKRYDASNLTVYDGSTKDPAFNMNGRSFYQGLVIQSSGEVSFNTENVDEISFLLGHVDDTDRYDGTMTIYLDEKKYDTISLTGDMETIEYTINVSDAAAARIVTSVSYGFPKYALGDVSIKTYGDCNGDGILTAADAVLLQKWLLALPDATIANPIAADMNQDDKLSAMDLSLLKQALIAK